MPRQNYIQFRRGTYAEWYAQATGILSSGEPAYEIDTGRLKIGDGSTPWDSLPYSYIVPTGFIAGTGINLDFGANGSFCGISVSGLSSSGIIDFNDAVDTRIENNLFNSVIRGSFLLTTSSGTFTVDEGYTIGSLDVFLNGVKLSETAGDYTATNGSSFTLSETAPSGSIVEYLTIIPGVGGGGGGGKQTESTFAKLWFLS